MVFFPLNFWYENVSDRLLKYFAAKLDPFQNYHTRIESIDMVNSTWYRKRKKNIRAQHRIEWNSCWTDFFLFKFIHSSINVIGVCYIIIEDLPIEHFERFCWSHRLMVYRVTVTNWCWMTWLSFNFQNVEPLNEN